MNKKAVCDSHLRCARDLDINSEAGLAVCFPGRAVVVGGDNILGRGILFVHESVNRSLNSDFYISTGVSHETHIKHATTDSSFDGKEALSIVRQQTITFSVVALST
jgi:hypothetical protein